MEERRMRGGEVEEGEGGERISWVGGKENIGDTADVIPHTEKVFGFGGGGLEEKPNPRYERNPHN